MNFSATISPLESLSPSTMSPFFSWDNFGAHSWNIVAKSRFLFYVPNPYETMFAETSQVPRYINELYPSIIFFAFLENIIRLFRGKSLLRLNDSLASIASGIFQDCFRLSIRSVELLCYSLIFEHFRIATLPWDSVWTWLLCFVLVDWGFYWAHRLAHEVNFIWAIHQAHHSGEDFTFVAALRQAVLQPFTAWITYSPLALIGIPPSIFLAHIQLTELYMIWIHTEAVTSLGPLEYIFNCPSHHRVHHARNRQYIDKNYGGVFIIWDRWFGTFTDEDPNEPAVYGLVHPVDSYNIFYIQFHSWLAMGRAIRDAKSWKTKFMIPFKGPGWSEGKPRLGYYDDIPELQHPVQYWDPKISVTQTLYVLWHFAITLMFYHELSLRSEAISQWTLVIGILSVLTSLTSIGFLLENKTYALAFEMLRCLVFFFVEQRLQPLTELTFLNQDYRYGTLLAIRTTFLLSATICAVAEFHRISQQAIEYFNRVVKFKQL